MIQLNLFTNKICFVCGKNPGISPRNPNLWNGFLDKETGNLVCWKCRKIYYGKTPATRIHKQRVTSNQQPVSSNQKPA
jgi:hypothetical protein